jgi:hypothetical protein
VRGTGQRVLLIGDSHAAMLVPAFEEIAREDDLTLAVSVRGGCPWQRNLFPSPVTPSGTKLSTSACRRQKDDLYTRVVPKFKPDIIIAMNLGHENPAEQPFLGPAGIVVKNGTPASAAWLRTTTRESVTELRASGAKLMLIEPTPIAPASFDPLVCISKAKVVQECRYVAQYPQPDPLELYYRLLAKQDHGVFSADFDRLVCPFLPICDPIVNGQIVKLDATHLTPKFVKSLAPAIETYMKQVGLLNS